jgi:EmrB/QacA subfamily drug resistance transporter
MNAKRRMIWTFVVTSAALFMASLDNLVVTTALPSIRAHLHASLAGLEWTVNAYTLTFAVLLLTGAALGERYGRKKLFMAGLAIFTLSSAAAALAPGISWLVAARAGQGVGAAALIPLTLTLLSAAVPQERRGLALGAWGAVGGLAVAIGPLVGGAVVEGASWQWIFWLNVPIGLILLPLAATRLTDSRGPAARLDLPGVALASAGLVGIVLGMVRGNAHGWTSVTVLPPLAAGAVLIAAFVAWELRARPPMLPMRLFRSPAFSATNLASLLMFFGMFGSIFLLAQFLQTVQHYSPLQAGLRTLPWTGMPVLVAPVAGSLSDRIGGRPLLVAGLALQAAGLGWLAAVATPAVPYPALVPAFIICGIGMSLFFAPVATVVLGSVRPEQEGLASGANNAIRELGGVLGIAVLGAVFSAHGGYATGHTFVSGLTPALCVGAAGVAAAAALLIPQPANAPGPRVALPAQPARQPRPTGTRRRPARPAITTPSHIQAADRHAGPAHPADPPPTEQNSRPTAQPIVIGGTS